MPFPPPAPTNLTLSASFSNSKYQVTAAWDPNPDPLFNHYEVTVAGQVFVVAPAHLTFTAQPQASYDISVRADNVFGDQSATSTSTAPIVPQQFITTNAWAATSGEGALIDTHYYLATYQDVAQANVAAGAHFTSSGWQEQRNPDALFDTAYYLAHNPDVAAAHIDPLLHFVTNGWKEGRDPGPNFSVAAYLAANPDVKLAGVNPLEHYLHFGFAEGRHLA